MNVAHFFHLYSAGEWRDPLAEHLAALEVGGYDGPFHVGLVGDPSQRAEALDELRWIRPPDTVIEADTGWEQVTLHELHAYAQDHDGAVLYAHTKGAHDPSTVNIAWRRSMSWHLVRNWRACTTVLNPDHGLGPGGEPYDAVGCHWLTPEEFPGHVDHAPLPCFGGNFWTARCGYVRQLLPCADSCRHDAEGWIGTGNPRVLDLYPGWPGDFAPVKYGRLVAGR